jgi:hypothetical protein
MQKASSLRVPFAYAVEADLIASISLPRLAKKAHSFERAFFGAGDPDRIL